MELLSPRRIFPPGRRWSDESLGLATFAVGYHSVLIPGEAMRNGEVLGNPYFSSIFTDAIARHDHGSETVVSFGGLRRREHTAQVSSSKAAGMAGMALPLRGGRQRRASEQRRLSLKDASGRSASRSASCRSLFCSPTMELGVDISAARYAVYLRNVPPIAGQLCPTKPDRAGRSGSGRRCDRHLLRRAVPA